MEVKKLIEVAMPVKEVSAESVRDKSIRHGHISTLHLWWARRPLPVCRAVVFASLVPDPLDKNCPKVFKEAVAKLLSGSQYKPYDDIPWTAAIDPMEDNLRNRLMMFIGKFSPKFIDNEKIGKKTPAKDQIDANSLIKWDNKNNEEIIGRARKLIWVAYNAESGKSCKELLDDFDKHYEAIKSAESALYETADRHFATEEIKAKETALQSAIDAFLEKMPKVFDPFAGGGAIPLEAARLGCRSYGNDLNPVAHIIQRASLEFPQKYGKPTTYSKEEFIKLYGEDEYTLIKGDGLTYDENIKIENRLAFDVEFYSKKLLKMAEEEIGLYYPADKDGNKPVAYYWARVATCSNPTCRAEVPLLKGFYLCNKPNKKVHLKPVISGNQISFDICNGTINEEGWISRGNLTCPCCGNTTDVKTVKQQFLNKTTSERLLAVIWNGNNGKEYKLPTDLDLDVISKIPDDISRPTEPMPVKYTQALPSCTWGLSEWGQMFSDRQILAMQTLVAKLAGIKKELKADESEYGKAVITYLGLLVDRVAVVNTTFGVWHTKGEKLERPMGRQAIPMVFDYPESNLFCDSTGSANNQIDWLTRYINSESKTCFHSICNNSSSGEVNQFPEKSLSAVITDPPYYDAIAYADLSDFFYVWLKRTLGDVFPLNFAFPQTPKTEECTALKHHHDGSANLAKEHFENKLLQIFSAIERQTKGVVSIMFAHQSTEAWTTLVNSVLKANMNLTGSWAISTEQTSALKTNKAFLASSVTVSCRPTEKESYGDFKEISRNIEARIKEEVKELYAYGFRGADLLTACFGQAVSEFGQYETVEKSDGTEVTVAELLEMAREAAFNAIISDIETDDVTRFYIGWLNLYGFVQADHDDVRRISQIGLNVDTNRLLADNILLREKDKETLADYATRNKKNKNLGNQQNAWTIDKAHKAMQLFKIGDRRALVAFIAKFAPDNTNILWRVLNSLAEVLPAGTDDHKQATGLLANSENLIREAKTMSVSNIEQMELL